MKLYTFPRGPNPRRVHIYLAEKGLELESVYVNLMKRENRTPEFIQNINVMGGLPVLELDDGSHIAESVAICRYLETLYPEPVLFGSDAREQAFVNMWLRRIELNFMVPVGQVWIHGSPLTKAVNPDQIAEVAERSRRQVDTYFGLLDAELAQREFIAGDCFSMADIVALCTLDFGSALNKLHPTLEQTHLARWHAAVSSRASVADN